MGASLYTNNKIEFKTKNCKVKAKLIHIPKRLMLAKRGPERVREAPVADY